MRMYCGTIELMGRMVDVYEERLVVLFDGIDEVKCDESELLGIVKDSKILDWHDEKSTPKYVREV